MQWYTSCFVMQEMTLSEPKPVMQLGHSSQNKINSMALRVTTLVSNNPKKRPRKG